MRWTSLPLGRLALFLLLNVADFAETWVLIRLGDGSVYESNPIAQAWLSAYGWQGLFLFKVLAVLVVVTATLMVWWRRPRLGNSLLTIGCLILGGVTVYSGRMLATNTHLLAAL
jgi:hypothetical protein